MHGFWKKIAAPCKTISEIASNIRKMMEQREWMDRYCLPFIRNLKSLYDFFDSELFNCDKSSVIFFGKVC